MKLHKTTTIALQSMLLLGMFTACQNQDSITPSETTAPNHDNAKIAASEIKLVNDGDNKLQYVKSGRYTGKLSKVSELNYYTEYSYDNSDSGIDGAYWITSKRYLKSTNLLERQIQYHVINSKCVKMIDLTANQTFNLNYGLSYNSELGRLEKISLEGSSTKIEFSYLFDSAASSDRLYKATYSNNNGAYKEISFIYATNIGGNFKVAPKPDKYFLNPAHLNLDKYLPIFGKFSDALVQGVTISPLPNTGQTKPFYLYTYATNGNGYVTFRTENHYPLGEGNQAGKQSTFFALKYLSWVPGL